MVSFRKQMEDPYGHNASFALANNDHAILKQLLKKLSKLSPKERAVELCAEVETVFKRYQQGYERMKDDLDEFKMNVLCKLEDQTSTTIDKQDTGANAKEWDVNPFLIYAVSNKP